MKFGTYGDLEKYVMDHPSRLRSGYYICENKDVGLYIKSSNTLSYIPFYLRDMQFVNGVVDE